MPAWLYPDASSLSFRQAKCNFFADHPEPGVNLPSLWQAFADAWGYIAGRYAGNDTVVGADIINEPYNPQNLCSAQSFQLDRFYSVVGRVIRSVNPNIALVFEDTADQGNGVIVGHAAQYTLRDTPGVLRVLVHGSLAERAKRLAEEKGLLLRGNPWSDGAGLDHATARGAAVTAGMDEFYGRAMPAPPARIREEDFVPLSQLYGRWARIYTEEGRDITPPSVSWSENDLAQRIGARAWYVLDDEGLEHARERVEAGRAAGGTVVDPSELPFATPPGSRVAVHVAAAVTHTIGGIRIDTNAQALEGVHVAGVDAGGVATGGYASGLAQALVLGLVAAESLRN